LGLSGARGAAGAALEVIFETIRQNYIPSVKSASFASPWDHPGAARIPACERFLCRHTEGKNGPVPSCYLRAVSKL